MAAGTFVTKAWTEFPDGWNGSSRDDVGNVYYFFYENLKAFFNEANASLTMDQASITPVTGFTPGTYEEVWFFPKTLTVNEFAQTDCSIGPIEATVVIGSSGEVTSITPTLKNGCYKDGEVLRMISNTPHLDNPLTGGSAPVEVTLTTGSSIDVNLAGHRYWAKEGLSFTSSGAFFYIASNRPNVYQDALYMRRSGKNITTNTTTTTYSDFFYGPTGWDSTKGRGQYNGNDNTYSTSMTVNTSGDGYYHFYYNTTPGAEVCVWGDTQYKSLLGFYKADTSVGYIGQNVFSDWINVIGSGTQAMGYLAIDSDPIYGYGSRSMSASITRSGFFKPWYSAESDNFIVAGGNENLLHCADATPMFGVYSTADGLVNFRKIGTYTMARV